MGIVDAKLCINNKISTMFGSDDCRAVFKKIRGLAAGRGGGPSCNQDDFTIAIVTNLGDNLSIRLNHPARKPA